MACVSISEARAHLTNLVKKVAYEGKRIILTKQGKELVAIVSLEDLISLEHIENRADLEDAQKALSDIEKRESISWNEVKKALDS